MIKIAIVEDELSNQTLMQRYIKESENNLNESFQITTFSDGLDLVEDYDSSFDIIFMDIEMKHMDGMEAARKIRCIDKTVIIIFITNMPQYAIAGYEVQAMDYVLKPINQFAFQEEIRKAIYKINEHRLQYIYLVKNNSVTRLAIQSIIYVESQGNNVIYHLKDKEVVDRNTIKNVEKELMDYHFFRCNSGVLVNLAMIESVDDSGILAAGSRLLVSRGRKKEFMTVLTAYLGGR